MNNLTFKSRKKKKKIFFDNGIQLLQSLIDSFSRRGKGNPFVFLELPLRRSTQKLHLVSRVLQTFRRKILPNCFLEKGFRMDPFGATKSGWLEKLGGKSKSWKKRFFVIYQNVLLRYDKPVPKYCNKMFLFKNSSAKEPQN